MNFPPELGSNIQEVFRERDDVFWKHGLYRLRRVAPITIDILRSRRTLPHTTLVPPFGPRARDLLGKSGETAFGE